jgi:hypothetical protein
VKSILKAVLVLMLYVCTFPALRAEVVVVGPARAAMLRAGIPRPQAEAARTKRLRNENVFLGAEWDDYSSYVVYTYISYEGTPEQGAFVVEHRTTGEFKRFELRPQVTEITASDGAWGIIADVPSGTKEMHRYASVTRLGRYRLSAEVGGRQRNYLIFDVQVILDPYACYWGAGTDLVSVEFYASYFDKPPHTNAVEVHIGGREVDARMHLFEKGVARIDVVVTWEEYREIFNSSTDRFDWSEKPVQVDTDSKIPSVRRTLGFPSPPSVPHC